MARVVLLTFSLTLLAACATMHQSPDFTRHRFSTLTIPHDNKDLFFFDVMTNGQYPADDPVAENTRMEWLSAWLKARKMCPDGFEIIQRREFDFIEHNPGRYDFRYEVKCKLAVFIDE